MAVVNPRTQEAFNAHWGRILSNADITALAILVEEVPVGHISCFKMEGLDSVGYWIAREHWGRGIATRALTLLLQLMPIRPLHAHAASTNLGSIRVLRNCGFRITGHQLSPATDRFPECEEAILVLTPTRPDGDEAAQGAASPTHAVQFPPAHVQPWPAASSTKD